MAIIEEKVASVNDLKDGEMKEVPVGGKKVLLSRVEGKYYATGMLCTHYKAPLSKGTLSSDGRLVCPWHGACFNVKTGDVEDAPALDALASYQVKIEGNDVVVVAEEALLQDGRRVPGCTVPSQDDSRVFVIIGGGAAGHVAASTLRENGFKGRVVLISKEPHLPVDRVKLSKSVKVELDKILLRPEEYFTKAGIETRLGQEVIGVDPQGKNIRLLDGSSLHYDRLLVCPGANPRFFWGDITRFNNVVTVRTAEDATRIEKVVESKPCDIIVLGSSFIGMEAAAVLAKVGKSVTVIGMEKVPFERVLGEKVGKAFQSLHEEKGIKFRMSAVVESMNGEGTCTSITLQGGEQLACDLVVVGAGVAPATDFLKSNFNLERDGSILADRYLKVSQYEDIYVAGDCARFPTHMNTGIDGTVRIEHWCVAQQQGRIAALNMLDKKTPFETIPFFWTAQYGKSLRYVGHAPGYEDVIIEGSLEDLSFIAYYVKGDTVLAVASLGKDPACSNASELMRLNKMPTATQIRNGKSVLDIASPSSPSDAKPVKKVVPPPSPVSPSSTQNKPSGSLLSKAFPLLVVVTVAMIVRYLASKD